MLVLHLLSLAAALQGSPDFRWHGVLAVGKTIEIRGINGGISATPAGGREVEVEATKHAKRSDPASVEIRVVSDGNGVTICAVYPSDDRIGCDEHTGRRRGSHDNNDVAVEFVVKVPAGVNFVGQTVNGSVTASDLRGDAEATTVNGGVSVTTTGMARATTVNGDVRVVMGRLDGTGSMEFGTVNGDVDVTLPASAAMNVHASTTNGGLHTDFPLTISGRFGPRSMRGTIGGGGRSLDLTTVNGSINLRRGS